MGAFLILIVFGPFVMIAIYVLALAKYALDDALKDAIEKRRRRRAEVRRSSGTGGERKTDAQKIADLFGNDGRKWTYKNGVDEVGESLPKAAKKLGALIRGPRTIGDSGGRAIFRDGSVILLEKGRWSVEDESDDRPQYTADRR